jgi:hypothetical protein
MAHTAALGDRMPEIFDDLASPTDVAAVTDQLITFLQAGWEAAACTPPEEPS